MTKFTVDTAQLQSAGSQLMSDAEQYRSHYRALIQACQDTKQGWNASDNTAFITKVVGLEDDFAKMYQTLYGAGNDMIQAAQRYDSALQSNISRANSLSADF